ncbi:AbrB/MazE/SpoVT family DNA-binding domain-containing protein [Sediminibacillus dalangtanensis]|uniref:AbrB/MazE/SpoVT family DNA-binding domain-containing protein n=1 Tax=Sediminibacillus dalangtanensis TaxID=2729421 RepID=A0ABX7VUV0_9BACI|nr:AbrB/MazE/SpoVT family DNA-binding domain-containing protein [Sediminibacillus dalangtanensis]QTN00758.1 AbrB/MazE/SpoVT family DNA-binding domain-containing protein [Sediminibacillus dalangtanensis]
MKSTGVVRKLDQLGRIVIPMEVRRNLEIEEKDPVEIFVDEDKIVLQKYKPRKQCMITGEISEDNIVLPSGIVLSPKGMEILQEQIEENFPAKS